MNMESAEFSENICDDFSEPQTFVPAHVPIEVQRHNTPCVAYRSERWDAIGYRVNMEKTAIEQENGMLCTDITEYIASYATLAFHFREPAFHLTDREYITVVFDVNACFAPKSGDDPADARTWIDVLFVPAGEVPVRPQSQNATKDFTVSQRGLAVSIYADRLFSNEFAADGKHRSLNKSDRSALNGKVYSPRLHHFRLAVGLDHVRINEDGTVLPAILFSRPIPWLREGVDIWFAHQRYNIAHATPRVQRFYPKPLKPHRLMWDNIGCFIAPP